MSDTELCRRCGERPGTERWYVPGEPGAIGFSLAGAGTKFSMKRTVGCEPCWQGFLESRGVPVRVCCGLRHEGVACPDDLVMCQLCFERVPLDQLRVVADGIRGATVVENVCQKCAAQDGVSFSGEVHLTPFWRSLPTWVPWLALWLLGAVLVVLGGGWQGVTAGVGLLLSGAGMGLLVRHLVEEL